MALVTVNIAEGVLCVALEILGEKKKAAHVIVHLAKAIECTTQRVKPNGNHGL